MGVETVVVVAGGHPSPGAVPELPSGAYVIAADAGVDRALALVGKPIEAREAAAAALAVYEAKGDIPASAGARELLDSLSS